jgi:hypothetical protein
LWISMWCPSSSPGIPCGTSPRRQCTTGRRAACRERQVQDDGRLGVLICDRENPRSPWSRDIWHQSNLHLHPRLVLMSSAQMSSTLPSVRGRLLYATYIFPSFCPLTTSFHDRTQ